MPAEKSPYPRQGSPLTWRLRAPVRAHLEARAARHARSLAGEVEVLVDLGLSIEERSGGDALFEAHLAAGATARAAADVMAGFTYPASARGEAARAEIVALLASQAFAGAATDSAARVQSARLALGRLLAGTQGLIPSAAARGASEVGEAWVYLSALLEDPALVHVLGREGDRAADAVDTLAQAHAAAVAADTAQGPPAFATIRRPGFGNTPAVRPWSALQVLAVAAMGLVLKDLAAAKLARVALAYAFPGHERQTQDVVRQAAALKALSSALRDGADPDRQLVEALATINEIPDFLASAASGEAPPAGRLRVLARLPGERVQENVRGLIALIARCAPHVAREAEADAQAAALEA